MVKSRASLSLLPIKRNEAKHLRNLAICMFSPSARYCSHLRKFTWTHINELYLK